MRIILLCACIATLFGCAEGPFDPSLINPSFQGITVTDESGTELGPVDETDWNVYTGRTTYPVDRSDQPIMTTKPAVVAKILPTQVAVHPAFPNPNDGLFVMQIDVPVECMISIWVIDADFQTVWRSLGNGTFAGAWAYEVSLTGDRRYVPDGTYRVVYEIQAGDAALHGYGDVRIVRKN